MGAQIVAMDKPKELVFLDIETGGLDKDKHPITQVAMVAVDAVTFEERGEYSARILFKEELAEKEALERNHYDPELWAKEGIGPGVALDQMVDFLRKHATHRMKSARTGTYYHVALAAGHNIVGFDIPFLFSWAERLCVAMKKNPVFLPLARYGVDTMTLAALYSARVANHPLDDHKLGTLAPRFGVVIEKEHDAMHDIRANIKIAEALLKSFGPTHTEPSVV